MELRFTEEDDTALTALAGELARLDADCADPVGLACAAVASEHGTACGCAGWRAADAVTALLTCLYVRPAFRRRGAAHSLVSAMEAHAAASGCHRMVVRLPESLADAAGFLAAMGYHQVQDETGRYWENEVSDGTMR